MRSGNHQGTKSGGISESVSKRAIRRPLCGSAASRHRGNSVIAATSVDEVVAGAAVQVIVSVEAVDLVVAPVAVEGVVSRRAANDFRCRSAFEEPATENRAGGAGDRCLHPRHEPYNGD